MKVTITKVSMKNFLSVGNKWTTVEFDKGLFRVTGNNLDNNTKNGVGKCVSGDTEVDIIIDDPSVKKQFLEFIKNGK
jgi:hypothetical protein